MINFTSLNKKICAFNQFFNEGKDGANLKRKAIVVTMFVVIIGAGSATAATTIANSEASSTTISGKPSRSVPPNREGSDEPKPNPSNTEGINQQGSLLT